MGVMLGNLSLEQFEGRSGMEFTEEERATLKASHQPLATLQGPEDWHVFDIPFVVTVGSADSEVVRILKASNERKSAKSLINVGLDEDWKKGSN